MVNYEALFEPDRKAGGFVVTFPDFGFGATQGETSGDARDMAEDLLKCLVQELMKKGEALPAPRKHRGRKYRVVSLPALQSAKAELYTAFRAAGIKKAELARRIGIPKTNVERIFDLDRASRLDQIEAAFRAIGKKLEVMVRSAA
jgi:antitoxin HicB